LNQINHKKHAFEVGEDRKQGEINFFMGYFERGENDKGEKIELTIRHDVTDAWMQRRNL